MGNTSKSGIETKQTSASATVASSQGFRLNLFEKIPGLRWFVGLRSFQFIVILPNLLIFHVIFLAGFFGTPVGNKNLAIVLIWIIWWFFLIAVMVPFASRIWCTVCPMPFFGDWVQRRALVKVRPGKRPGVKNRLYGLHIKWPKRLTNIWIQNFGFLALCTFSVPLVTRPIVSACVLGGMTVAATILALFFRMRSFCMYLCPVSGFLGLYSMTSTIELRSKDLEVCLECKTKSCRVGNENGWACPWFIYMGKLDRNNYCGLCMECVKACPSDNIALNLRPFATDTQIKGYDEAWKGFIMISLAMAYSLILLGPSGTVKDWANVPEVQDWSGFGLYTLILWSSSLVILPAIFFGCACLSRKLAKAEHVSLKEVFLGYSYLLTPLGLLAWIAFSVPLMFVNGSYIISVVSDPLGWGWDLFGTAHFEWTPLWPEYLVYAQMGLLALGLFYTLKKSYYIGEKLFGSSKMALRAWIPMGVFSVAVTLSFLRFFVG